MGSNLYDFLFFFFFESEVINVWKEARSSLQTFVFSVIYHIAIH